MPRRRPGPDEPLPTPFTVVIDTREQDPYTFGGLCADAKDQRRPLEVRQVVRGIPTGDYSIEGYEEQVAVERKSLADLFRTVGGGRRRFERELGRLCELDIAFVMVEGTWEDVLLRPPEHSELSPKAVERSVIAWQQRCPNVHWWTCNDRHQAEAFTFRILERFWKERQGQGSRRRRARKT
jgi:DNA excision repair protein ERCC-4